MTNLPATQKSLRTFVTSEQGLQIVDATEGALRIREMTDHDAKEAIVEAVAMWRVYIGIPSTEVSEEIVFAVKFIFEHYSFLTIKEISLAVNLSVLRKLRDTEFTGYFSPMYIAKVLNAYVHYQNMILAEARRARQKEEEEEMAKRNKPNREMQAENYRHMMKDFYEEWKVSGEIRDTFNLSYNYLRRAKFLLVDQEILTAAEKYGKQKVEELKKKSKNINSLSFNFEIEEKRWARNYCVCNYFKTVDINVLCDNIIPEHFN
jgi:hypothetical protein